MGPGHTWPYGLQLNKMEQNWIRSLKGWFIPNIIAFRPVVHEKNIFEDLSKLSLFFPLLGPKRGQPFIWTHMNPHPTSMIPTKFIWNWLSRSWEEEVDWKKVNGGRRTDCDGNSWLRWDKKKLCITYHCMRIKRLEKKEVNSNVKLT